MSAISLTRTPHNKKVDDLSSPLGEIRRSCLCPPHRRRLPPRPWGKFSCRRHRLRFACCRILRGWRGLRRRPRCCDRCRPACSFSNEYHSVGNCEERSGIHIDILTRVTCKGGVVLREGATPARSLIRLRSPLRHLALRRLRLPFHCRHGAAFPLRRFYVLKYLLK